MCLSDFVSNVSNFPFTLQKYIQYSLRHQWCKKIKVTIHPPKIHTFHPEKRLPYFKSKNSSSIPNPPFLGVGFQEPAPSFFNPKKSSILTKRPKRTHHPPRGRGPGYLPPEAEATQVGHLQGTRFDARERLARYKWPVYMSVSHPESHHPPERFFREARIRYGGGTHGNGIHTPEPSKGDRKTEWISEEMGKAMRCFTFWGGGEEGEKVQLFCLVSCDSCDFWVISSEKSEWVTCLCFWWIWIGCCFSYHLLLNLFASTPEMPQYWFSLHDLLFVSFIWVDGWCLTR